jgi:hypothetical protein
MALLPLLSKKLISTTNKLFRSASNTFWAADFVYIREQEILPLYKNVNVTLFRTFNHMIIMAGTSGSMLKVKGQGFIKRKFYESDRRSSGLMKSN